MTTTLDWYGCATFRLRTNGLTIMLDAYVDRAEGAAGPGLTADDIDECDWILIGHSHFDHLYGAERITANAPLSIRQAKKSIELGLRTDLRTGMFLEIEAYNRLIPTEDRHEGVRAFNEKRKPDFKGR